MRYLKFSSYFGKTVRGNAYEKTETYTEETLEKHETIFNSEALANFCLDDCLALNFNPYNI